MKQFTLVVPYYRNRAMLARQVAEWEQYPTRVKIICVDDGSPEPALDIIQRNASPELLERVRLYRITVDIPWNREGARNLAAEGCSTPWLVNVDIDHIMPAKAVEALLRTFEPQPGTWYRFPRYRQGKADETRRKDKLPPDATFGRIHPHIDSYLIERELYWRAGGYDEDYSGCLGGGSEFLRRLERTAGGPALLPDPICLHVYTRDRVADASDWSLSRDTSFGKQITRRKDAEKGRGNSRPVNPIRFPWVRQL